MPLTEFELIHNCNLGEKPTPSSRDYQAAAELHLAKSTIKLSSLTADSPYLITGRDPEFPFQLFSHVRCPAPARLRSDNLETASDRPRPKRRPVANARRGSKKK